MAQHPKLMKRWLVFANHVLTKSTISGRDRELAILRAGWRCNAPYEWGQHVMIGQSGGHHATRRSNGSRSDPTPRLDPHDAAILRAVDELHDTSTISDATWATLVRDLRPAADDGSGLRHRPVPPRLLRVERLRGRARRRARRDRGLVPACSLGAPARAARRVRGRPAPAGCPGPARTALATARGPRSRGSPSRCPPAPARRRWRANIPVGFHRAATGARLRSGRHSRRQR